MLVDDRGVQRLTFVDDEVAVVPLSWSGRIGLGMTSALPLAAAAAIPVLCSAWLLLAPGLVLSRQMTWDLLFNLSGAWHLAQGHSLHDDVHTVFGPLAFLPTLAGFQVVGLSPLAFVVGQLLVMTFTFVMAVLASARRLAPLPAFIFVTYLVLLVLLPANLGDAPNAYSFAMSYNRWGWAALATLCVILFVPPQRPPATSWLDLAIAATLLPMLFFLKITFAAAAFGAIAIAVVALEHVRARWRHWGALLVASGLASAAPSNWGYVEGILGAGLERVDITAHINTLVAARSEYALYIMTILVLVWLWHRGWARFEAVVAAVALVVLGVVVMSQNAQQGDAPLGIVIALVVYCALADLLRRQPPFTRFELRLLVALALVGPLLSVAAGAKVLLGYHNAATHPDTLLVPTATNLRGLAVPAATGTARRTLAEVGHELHGSYHNGPLRDPVTQAEYVDSILEAAALLTGGPVKVLVLDQVNPMPFVLGYAPPRGGQLWMWPTSPPIDPERVFGDVDVVLAPKYSTDPTVTAYALTTYRTFLASSFPSRTETAHWTVFRR